MVLKGHMKDVVWYMGRCLQVSNMGEKVNARVRRDYRVPLPQRRRRHVCPVLSISCKGRERSAPKKAQNELTELICIGNEIPHAKQQISFCLF